MALVSSKSDFSVFFCTSSMKIPGMHVELKPHQIHALKWQLRAEKVHSGGLNGHLPGLGKTIQALSLICMDRGIHPSHRKAGQGGTLIIVPACVTKQWFDQVKSKTNLSVFLFYDKWRSVLNDYMTAGNSSGTGLCSFLCQYDIVITSYSTILLDDLFKAAEKMHWFRIIIDEVHVLRNVTSKRFKALAQLQATYKWGLSGTLLMNTPLDLFGPMQFLGLWKQTERAKFIKALQRGEVAKHVLESSTEDVANLELPALNTEIRMIDLFADWEAEAYKALLLSSRRMVRSSIAANAEGARKTRTHIFALMMKLRQAANAVPLIDARYKDYTSSKCKAVIDLIQMRLNEDHTSKFILFSNFTQVLALYERLLHAAGIPSLIYSGELNAKQREHVLDRFKEGDESTGEDFCVLLASTPCANAGINITEANVVILNDLSYNPKIDEQCIARSHRIGQTRPVHVYKMICKNTVDERILSIQNRKTRMIDQVKSKAESNIALIKELLA